MDNEPQLIKSFISFAIDNSNRIISLFYCADKNGHCDIVIDYGFTKCFKNMKTKGTYTYFENIIWWMGKPEIMIYRNIAPTEFPKAIIFNINKNDKWDKFENLI